MSFWSHVQFLQYMHVTHNELSVSKKKGEGEMIFMVIFIWLISLPQLVLTLTFFSFKIVYTNNILVSEKNSNIPHSEVCQ